ncbi:MAG: hypothetical protein HOA61_01850, partial [Bacteroidetes bacterium]|nr:hypothetical protein [Bacteroidota bacterium]
MEIRNYILSDYEQLQYLWEVTGMGGKFRGDNEAVIAKTINAGGKLFVLIHENKL